MVRPRCQAAPHGCYAVDCRLMVSGAAFMCEEHTAAIPEANKTELRWTFDAWCQRLASRADYVAARIRAIIAVAEKEGKASRHDLQGILDRLDTGEWRYDVQPA